MPQQECPSCRQKSKAVKPITLHSLLKPDALATAKDATGYRHCAAQNCEVVYFHGESLKTFSKNALTVRVGTKETSSPRPVCYCFGHSWESIKKELQEKGTTSIIEDITAACRAKKDHCPEKNPQGSCCLGNVRRAHKEGYAALGLEPTAKKSISSISNCCSSSKESASNSCDSEQKVASNSCANKQEPHTTQKKDSACCTGENHA